MPTIKRGRGVVIVSTSKGLMTGAEAKAAGLGGELIASIY
jgi:small subunit ribosomal protein S8